MRILLISLLGVFMAGCADAPLADFGLKRIDKIIVDNKTYNAPDKATLGFEDDRIYGNAGCNAYFAGVSSNDGKIEIDAAGSTKMACHEESVNEFEYKFLTNLNGAFELKDNALIGKKLTIFLGDDVKN